MKTKRLMAILMVAILVLTVCVSPASASTSINRIGFQGTKMSENLSRYLEHCEVDINDSSIIEVYRGNSRASENGSSLHVITEKGDKIEETFLSYYDYDGNSLIKGDVGTTLLYPQSARGSSTSSNFYTSGVNVRITTVYTRTISGQNYIHLEGHYFTIYENTSSPTLSKMECDAFLVGNLYSVSNGKYTFIKSSALYTSPGNINNNVYRNLSYNTMYSGTANMPSNYVIVPENALGGLGMEFALYLNGSSSPSATDVYCISSGWY